MTRVRVPEQRASEDEGDVSRILGEHRMPCLAIGSKGGVDEGPSRLGNLLF